MAPLPPKSKASRAIMNMARAWKDVFDELPLLDESVTLETLIESHKRKVDELERRRDDLQRQTEEMSKSLVESSKSLQIGRAAVQEAQEKAYNIVSEAEKAASSLAARKSEGLAEHAAKVEAVAVARAQKIVETATTEAENYRRGVEEECRDLTESVATLRAEDAALKKSIADSKEEMKNLHARFSAAVEPSSAQPSARN